MTEFSRAERLRIAGRIAPIVRDAAYKGRSRVIKVVGRDGAIIRTIDSAELNAKLRERAGIEFDTISPRLATRLACIWCQSVFSAEPNRRAGRVRRICPECLDMPCATCGIGVGADRSRDAHRRGHRPYCDEHRPNRPVPPLPCAICGADTTANVSRKALKRGGNAYCADHAHSRASDRGRARKERAKCSICGATTTASASSKAKSGLKAYCSKHKWGRT